MIKDPLLKIKIVLWESQKKKTEIYFNKSVDDLLLMYQDDNINEAIQKINILLNVEFKKKEKIYVWTKTESIEFKIYDNLWDGYNINPFLATNIDNLNKIHKISYDLNTNGLFNYTEINVIYMDNDIFKNGKLLPYYFNNKEIPLIEKYKIINDNVKTLYTEKNAHILNMNFNKIIYTGKVLLKENIDLITLWEKINTTNDFQIQKWNYNLYLNLTRLAKNHNLSESSLEIFNKITSDRHCIILMANIRNNSSVYYYIYENNDIQIEYILNLKDKISYDITTKYIDIFLTFLKRYLDIKIQIQSSSMLLSVELIPDIAKMDYDIFVNNITKLPYFFNSIVVQKDNKIECFYKRSSININDFIKTRLNLKISTEQILQDLSDIGYKGADFNDIINSLKNTNKFKINKKTMHLGAFLTFFYNVKSKHITLNIVNIPNYNELQYMLYWISKICNIKAPIKEIKNIEEEEDSDSSQLIFHSSNSSDSSSGGSLIDNLKKLDKPLFEDKYSKKCQGKQPIGFTLQDFNENYKKKYNFDNTITYGSKDDMKHVYTCPRLWCPISQVPLFVDKNNVLNGKCPLENEKPVNTFNGLTHDTKRYIGFNNGTNSDGLCTPCCFKKLPIESIHRCIPEQKGTNVIQENEQKKDAVLTNINRIAENRLGTIPEIIHTLLLENTTYTNCTKNVSNHECFYRLGIKASNQSFFKSLLTILGITKEDFINKIVKDLNFENFLALENGNIVKMFINTYNKLDSSPTKDWYKNIKLDANTNLKTTLFDAYINYINYLKNDKIDKSPLYLYSLVATLFKKLLIVYQNDVSDDLYRILIPLHTDYNELISNFKSTNVEVVMIYLNKENTYEPIVFKSKKKKQKILLKNHPQLNHILNIEDGISINITLNRLTSYQDFISQINNAYAPLFKIDTLILHNNLTIDTFKLKCGIIIKIKNGLKPNLIPRLILDLKIIKIEFYDNLKDVDVIIDSDETFTLNMLKKLQEKNINVMATSFIKHKMYKYTIPRKINEDAFIFNNTFDNIDYNKEWFEFVQTVYYLIKNGKSKTEILKKLSTNKFVSLIHNIPYNNLNELAKWYVNIMYVDKMLSSEVFIDNSNYIFSGNALINDKIPKLILNTSYDINLVDKPILTKYKINKSIKKKQMALMDPNLNIFKGDVKSLPDKWKLFETHSMKYIENTKYDNNTIYDFFMNLDNLYLKKNVTKQDVMNRRNMNILKQSIDDEMFNRLLYDVSFKEILINEGGLSTTITPKTIVNDSFKNKEKRKDVIKLVLQNDQLKVNDYDIEAFANLLNVSVFIIYNRAQYNTDKDVKKIKRNSPTYLASSSILMLAKDYEINPFIMFYRYRNPVQTECKYLQYYFLSIDKKIYLSYDELPQELKELFNSIKQQKNE
jgi:hypothetical protein